MSRTSQTAFMKKKSMGVINFLAFLDQFVRKLGVKLDNGKYEYNQVAKKGGRPWVSEKVLSLPLHFSEERKGKV